jgi:signal transduction histidine kinase
MVAVSRLSTHFAAMSDAIAGAPRIRPRRSLSGRLWVLATLAVLVSEIAVFLPYIARERSSWLIERVQDASIAVLAASGEILSETKRSELLRLSGTEAIILADPSGQIVTVGDFAAHADATIDLREEGWFTKVGRALEAIVFERNRLIHLIAANGFHAGTTVELWLHERKLRHVLRHFAGDFAGLALLIAGAAGGLIYLALLVLLVRPMRRITGSIAAFRADPEGTIPLDPKDVTVLPDDEMAVAGQQLAAMQHELRGALWRNARLAALGTVVAKVSHDLRGILTPALLTAERLQRNSDSKVRHAGDTLALAVERATDLVRRTLDYAREGPPPLDLTPVALAPLVSEAAESVRTGSALRLNNRVEPVILVRADRIQLFRVLTNLMRNAAEAGARSVSVSAHRGSPVIVVEIADDGPGLPGPVRAELFRPFAGSMRRGGAGLGLAIVRDLMVAHGGEIELAATGETGTTFRLTLRACEPRPVLNETAAGEARIAPPASSRA